MHDHSAARHLSTVLSLHANQAFNQECLPIMKTVLMLVGLHQHRVVLIIWGNLMQTQVMIMRYALYASAIRKTWPLGADTRHAANVGRTSKFVQFVEAQYKRESSFTNVSSMVDVYYCVKFFGFFLWIWDDPCVVFLLAEFSMLVVWWKM
uniref:Uncharacterized protein n=1 Tax=Opuntia streptacantha TaxID=393608 RepID=A0A7C8ZBD7_OPUST